MSLRRDHDAYLRDLETSRQHDFNRGPSPFAYKTKLADAPHFRWTMVKCDWMHVAIMLFIHTCFDVFFGDHSRGDCGRGGWGV